jgi:hypothetical protein
MGKMIAEIAMLAELAILPIGKARGRTRAVTPSTEAGIQKGSHGAYKHTARREACGGCWSCVHLIASRVQTHSYTSSCYSGVKTAVHRSALMNCCRNGMVLGAGTPPPNAASGAGMELCSELEPVHAFGEFPWSGFGLLRGDVVRVGARPMACPDPPSSDPHMHEVSGGQQFFLHLLPPSLFLPPPSFSSLKRVRFSLLRHPVLLQELLPIICPFNCSS